MLVLALVPHSAVEAHGLSVFGRLARLDEVDGDVLFLGPLIQSLARDLRAIVAKEPLLGESYRRFQFQLRISSGRTSGGPKWDRQAHAGAAPGLPGALAIVYFAVHDGLNNAQRLGSAVQGSRAHPRSSSVHRAEGAGGERGGQPTL